MCQNMETWSWMLLCFVCFFLAHLCSADKKQQDLQIIQQYVPEECYQKSAEGDQIAVHYTGTLQSGQVFDSSHGRGEPFIFVLGEKRVIRGWELGLDDMCVGEKRKLIISPRLGYGSKGAPPTIPPEATLTFETELVGLQKESVEKSLMRLIRFLGLPTAAGLIVYYLYHKYQADVSSSTKNRDKEERRSKKKRS